MAESQNISVYAVAGREESRVNDRVIKLLSLRDQFHAVTLVTPGSKTSNAERLRVPPVVGVTGILRVLGLKSLKAAIDRYLYFPSLDIRFVWALRRPLLARLRDDLSAGRKVVVVLTFPSHALGRLAIYIKKQLPNVRVVLDWQDLWSYDPNYFERSPRLYRARIHRWEQQFIASADLHLTTNKRAAEVLINRYQAPAESVDYIEHHFHPDDLGLTGDRVAADSDAVKTGPVRLAFMGTLDKPPRVPGQELLQVLRRVNATDRQVEFHVYGNPPTMTSIQRQEAADHGIVFHGLVSHEEATRALLDYEVLVVLLADMPNSRVVLSIKLPHYLLANRPVLAIVPQDSAIADVIAATGAGRVISSSPSEHSDWQTVVANLLADQQQLRRLDADRSQAAVDAYHWDNIAPRWVAAITGEPSSGNNL